MIRHNLDVMHIEKNVFDNIFNTIMEIEGKTKDTSKYREELNDFFCDRNWHGMLQQENTLKLVTLGTSRRNKPCVNG